MIGLLCQRGYVASEKFIELLSSLPERFGVKLHGYALMGNHYYLQLERPRGEP